MTFNNACRHARSLLEMGIIVRIDASPERKPIDVRTRGADETAVVTIPFDVPGRHVNGSDLRFIMGYADEAGLEFKLETASIVLT